MFYNNRPISLFPFLGPCPVRPVRCSAAPLLECVVPLVRMLAGCESRQTKMQVAAVLCHLANCEVESEERFAFAARIVRVRACRGFAALLASPGLGAPSPAAPAASAAPARGPRNPTHTRGVLAHQLTAEGLWGRCVAFVAGRRTPGAQRAPRLAWHWHLVAGHMRGCNWKC